MRDCLPVLLAASTVVGAGCMSDPAPSTASSMSSAIGSTVPQPGSCDPDVERLPAPSIVIDGTSTDSSFGVGAYECGTISGDGYIVYTFTPCSSTRPGRSRCASTAGLRPRSRESGHLLADSPGVWESTQPAMDVVA